MTRPQTVIKEQYDVETFEFKSNVDGSITEIEIFGMTPDRTYEDRDVYFAMGTESMNIRAEDAIALGQALITHGTNALMANMVQHQHIHHVNQLKSLIVRGYVEKIVMTQLSTEVPNYGPGFRLFLMKPVWKNKAPEFEEDFEFETVYYPSPFEEEFEKELAYWEVPIEFVGYDREQDLADFQKKLEEFEKEQTMPTVDDIEVASPVYAVRETDVEPNTSNTLDDLGSLIKLQSFRDDYKKGLDTKASQLIGNAFVALLQESAVADISPLRILATLEANRLLASKLEFEVTDGPMYDGVSIPSGHLFNTTVPFPKDPYNKDFLESFLEQVAQSLTEFILSNIKKGETLVLYTITCEKVHLHPTESPKACFIIRGIIKRKDSIKLLK